MYLTRTDDALILRDQSGAVRILGGFFIAVGSVFVYGGMGGYSNATEVGLGMLVLSVALGAIAVAAGVACIRGAVRVRIQLNRARRALSIRTTVWGKTTERTLAPGAIAELVLETTSNSEGDTLHGIVAVLTSGERVPLGVPDSTLAETMQSIMQSLASEAGLRVSLAPTAEQTAPRVASTG